MNTSLTTLIQSFRPVAEQLPCLLIADADGCYAYVNHGWCAMMGRTEKDVIGKPVRQFVPDTKVDEVLRTGETALGYMVRTPEGKLLFNNCIPLLDGKELIGIIIFTFFTGVEEALGFSKKITEMTEKLAFYKNELRELRGARYSLDAIVGSSRVMQKVKEQIGQAARTSSSVLIEGETGCGKELVANAVHELSARSENAFIKINCSAIPDELVESELFGYEKGAFSGADARGKKGLFEAADRGTLFLDEISSMAYAMQPKLLRVLQEKEIRHVGGTAAIPVDVRVIAASNRDLDEMVRQEKFREDLLYRLDVVHLYIPPLRERLEDIPELAEHIRMSLNQELGTYVEGMTAEAEELLMSYEWPGNVRELRNILERAVNDKLSGVLTGDDIQKCLARRRRAFAARVQTLAETKKNAEREQIMKSLADNRYNKTKTAHELGISRTLLYQKMRQYGLQ